jgi:hypothetical protein
VTALHYAFLLREKSRYPRFRFIRIHLPRAGARDSRKSCSIYLDLVKSTAGRFCSSDGSAVGGARNS